MQVRGIRGAITIEEDDKSRVLAATQELLSAMQAANDFLPEDIASILFTVTSDIRSAFPAEAARLMGWNCVPLLCFQEIEVPGSIPRCIRVLIHINTTKAQGDIKHTYLGEARALRRDLAD
ncbi:MAG TPA: chorismate mutase [Syntrophomonas sp.]|jgi:chorismate mutase|nr:chorismate mutase [Syntrophomonas sp.]